MVVPFELPDLCDIFRPFNAAVPLYSDVPCRFVPALYNTRGIKANAAPVFWTHFVDFQPTVDIRDSTVRISGAPQQSFAQGDRIEIATPGRLWKLITTWVELRYSNTDNEYLRAYCIRDRVDPI